MSADHFVIGQTVHWKNWNGKMKDGRIEHVGREHIIVRELRGRRITDVSYCLKKAEIANVISEKANG